MAHLNLRHDRHAPRPRLLRMRRRSRRWTDNRQTVFVHHRLHAQPLDRSTTLEIDHQRDIIRQLPDDLRLRISLDHRPTPVPDDNPRLRLRPVSPLLDEPEFSRTNPEAQMMVREDYRRVLAAIQKMEPEERDVLSLVVSSDLSYREIARITGTSEGNVKIRVHRARVKLRKMMNTGEK